METPTACYTASAFRFQLTLVSSNQKTGPIPVSTSSANTCPDVCPFKKNGCYADSGPLAFHWMKVTKGERGGSLEAFTKAIKAFPKGQLWRHNQAGDLMGENNTIDAEGLRAIVKANKGRKGYTYTHKPMTEENQALVKEANENGFTINLSGNNLKHADKLKALGIAPVTAIVPENAPDKGVTPEGNRWIACPAQTRENVSCASCKLCSVSNRGIIIAFKAHGTSKKKAMAASESY
jgi:hypothetical protein